MRLRPCRSSGLPSSFGLLTKWVSKLQLKRSWNVGMEWFAFDEKAERNWFCCWLKYQGLKTRSHSWCCCCCSKVWLLKWSWARAIFSGLFTLMEWGQKTWLYSWFCWTGCRKDWRRRKCRLTERTRGSLTWTDRIGGLNYYRSQNEVFLTEKCWIGGFECRSR